MNVSRCVAADFLFPLDYELELQGQLAGRVDPGLRALEMREHLPLIVGGPPGVEIPVADGGLEGGRFPLIQRVGGLYVVMAIDQHRRGARHRRRLGVHDRVARRRHQLDVQLHGAKLVGHPVGGLVDVVAMLAVGADAGDAQQFAQFALEAVALFTQIVVKGRHIRKVSTWPRSRLPHPQILPPPRVRLGSPTCRPCNIMALGRFGYSCGEISMRCSRDRPVQRRRR